MNMLCMYCNFTIILLFFIFNMFTLGFKFWQLFYFILLDKNYMKIAISNNVYVIFN